MSLSTPIYIASPYSRRRSTEQGTKAWTREEFEKQLRSKENRYHINHEFHILMNSGKLEKPAIQGWVANRFYYQVAIPVKDAAVMANCPDRDVRRHWVQRILDHDGQQDKKAASKHGYVWVKP